MTAPIDYDPAPVIEQVRVLAREVGWCIAVHGTLKRDIDLIATPWTHEAISRDAFRILLYKHFWAGGQGHKPCGRFAQIFLQKGCESIPGTEDWWPPQLDISYVDPRQRFVDVPIDQAAALFQSELDRQMPGAWVVTTSGNSNGWLVFTATDNPANRVCYPTGNFRVQARAEIVRDAVTLFVSSLNR